MRENWVDAAACAAIALGLALLAWVLLPMVIPDTKTAEAATQDPGIARPYSSDEGTSDSAQGFARAGQRGFPITCTITVDGQVTERQATAGPYGALFCQG